jgi:hypothetical protein
MDEHDLDRLALLIVGRGYEEREVQPNSEQDKRHCREPRDDAVDEAQETRRIGKADHGGWSSWFARLPQ